MRYLASFLIFISGYVYSGGYEPSAPLENIYKKNEYEKCGYRNGIEECSEFNWSGGGYSPNSNTYVNQSNQEIENMNTEVTIKKIPHLKSKCQELGFKEGSKKFKECIMDLMK